MTIQRSVAPGEDATRSGPDGAPRRRALPGRVRALASAGNLSAVYLAGILLILFYIWIPDTFFTSTTFRSILADDAVTLMVALAVVVPLAAGVFDVSVGSMLGLGAMVGAYWAAEGHPVWQAIVLAMVVGAAAGTINAVLVVKVGIDSFIATIGTSSVILGVTNGISNSQQITGIGDGFQQLASNQTAGIVWPVYYALALALGLWYVLEHTRIGRYLYATGYARESARLAGVRVDRLRFCSLIVSGTIAAAAGVIVTARTGAGSPDVGPPYLLPAFAGAFFGATQLKHGRFNVWGTVLAVYVVGMGVKGLELAGVKFWIKDSFTGAILLFAVGLAAWQGKPRVPRLRRLGKSGRPVRPPAM